MSKRMDKYNYPSAKEQFNTSVNLDARRYLSEVFSVKKKYNWYEWVFNHFDFPKEARILELGCGLGNLWIDNENRIPKTWDITLSDFSSAMLEKTKDNVKKINRDFKFKIIDITEKIPFEEATFDVVIANHLLYFIPDIEKSLAEIFRVMKPGGVFVATTSSANYMIELNNLLKKSKLPVHNDYSDYSFSMENGQEWLTGFFEEVKEFRYIGELNVTEAEPMANYVLSTNQNLSERQQELVRNFFKEYFDKNKELYITRETGLFLAKK